MKLKLFAVILLLSGSLFAQTPAGGTPYLTAVQGPGNLVKIIPLAPIVVCAFPASGGTPCTNLIQTYSDPTENVSCPSTAQVVSPSNSTCSNTSDAEGNFEFFVNTPATVTYYFKNGGTWNGPFTASVGGGSGGGGGGGGGTITGVQGTLNQINVTSGTTTPVVSFVTNPTLPGAVTITGSVTIAGNANLAGNLTMLGQTFTGIKGNSGIFQQAGTISGTGYFCPDANQNTTNVGCPPITASAAGSTTEVQFRNSGTGQLAADSSFNFTSGTHTLNLTNLSLATVNVSTAMNFNFPYHLTTSIPGSPLPVGSSSQSGINVETNGGFCVWNKGGACNEIAAGTVINVINYGAKCDGTTNDSTAINNAFAAAVAVGTSTGTAVVQIPAGICMGNFVITQGKGIKIQGSGETSTHLRSPNGNPALQINGLWYSSFNDLTFDIFNHNATGAVLEIDGNYDGTHHQTVQFLTFSNVSVSGIGTSDGLLSLYTVAVCRQSSGACQGSNLTFINDAFLYASSAVYVQNGFNALSNQFIGGDFQQYPNNGMYINSGSVQVFGTTFETANQCSQVLNNGYDINTTGGNLQASLIYGVRSEGWQLVNGTASAPVAIDGLTQNSAWTTYAGTTHFNLNTAIKETGTDSKTHLYCATVAGTSGGSPPTWPATGTVTDGGITWTEENYNVVTLGAGNPNGFFNQMDSVVDSSAFIAIPNWYFPIGTIPGSGSGATVNYDLAVGSGTSAEHFIVSQTAVVDIFANPNSTATSSFSGISLPGNSSGILNKTDDLWLGIGLRQSHSDGIYHFTKTLEADQAQPTVTGCATISSQVGGATSGTFVTSGTSCTPVLTVLPTTAHGYACVLWDQTHPTAPIGNLSSTTTTATFGNFSTTASDVIAFQCGLSY